LPVDDPNQVGKIVDQIPKSGKQLLPGDTVNVTLGAAPATTTTTTTTTATVPTTTTTTVAN
jgi:beta-lactam-binding protein with PASTA domain